MIYDYSIICNTFKHLVLYLNILCLTVNRRRQFTISLTIVFHTNQLTIFLQDTVFHIAHESDLETALKYTCDYRRYKNENQYENDNKHPRFYHDVQSAIANRSQSKINESCVLVVNKISGIIKTQSDYYIQYVVDIYL